MKQRLMHILGLILMSFGILLLLVAGVWQWILAFKESLLWGLGCVFLSPVVPIMFLVKFWEVAKRPFFLSLAGLALLVVGGLLGGLTGMAPSMDGDMPSATSEQ